MDIQQLIQNIQTPEQMQALSAKLAKYGRPPQGTPGMDQAQQAPNPMQISQQPPAPNVPVAPPMPANVGEMLGGFR